MRSFCTIITNNYLPFAKTLYQSLKEFDNSVKLFVLVVDEYKKEDNLSFDLISLSDLSETSLVKNILAKYSQNSNALRWSLKPILLIHLLNKVGFKQAFYVDPDICFFSGFDFLSHELRISPFLLSPHWGCTNPRVSEDYFSKQLTDGIFNAGFLGATKEGVDTLFWWANMCLFSCEVNRMKGFFDDQMYLNLFLIKNPTSSILSHRGCNVAEWNRFECARILQKDGSILINNKYPIVFIHFSNISYLMEFDKLLIPYLDDYSKRLQDNGLTYDIRVSAKSYIDRTRLRSLSLGQRVFRKLIGRKRFSKFMKWE